MLAFVVHRARLEPRQRPLPRLRSGWALIRVRLAGICNTDLEILRGYHGFRGVPGHEFVGEVVEVNLAGRAKAAPWLGRRVVGEINIACTSLGRTKRCAYCRQGFPAHCQHRHVLGIVSHDGAFAEYLSLPFRNLHLVPDGVADAQAVFTEPLAAACEILEQVRIADHSELAILGDGKLAQLIAQVLRAAGRRVVMFGKHAGKLALAKQSGISTAQVNSRRKNEQLRHKRFSLVVEATGSPSGFALAQRLTAPRGTLVLKSTFHGSAQLETWPIVVDELTLVGSRCGPFPRALELLETERVDPRSFISRVFPLREAADAIRCAQTRGVLKVLLRTD